MARNSSDFYPGRRKKRSSGPAFVITLIALSLIAFAILLFYGLQKYLVISNNGLYLDIPFLSESGSRPDDDDIAVGSFETVDAELIIGEPDYTTVAATAGEGLSPIHCVFVPFESVSEEGIKPYADAAGEGGAVLLDLKTVKGQLAWRSNVDVAVGYGTSGTLDLAPIISSLHERGISVAARLCCFVDDALASRYAQVTLHKTDTTSYRDDNGAWLDPTSGVVRRYIAGLCRELSLMGVDEIVLNAMRLPDSGYEFSFVSGTSVSVTPEVAISGFAVWLTRNLGSIGARLSVQISSQAAMSGLDSTTGQDARLLLKVFDRVYRLSDRASAASEVSAAAGLISLGDIKNRYVPMCYDGAPETDCWALMS